jgi:hypothetical protein
VTTGERLLRAVVAPSAPLARIAVLRLVIGVFVVCDTLWIVDDVIPHSTGPQNLYSPLLMRRLLHLPVPNVGYAHALQAAVVVGALLTASGRLPRLSGLVLAAAFTDWVSIGMSYSKVDHDHFAIIVAVWVLPTVGGAARWRDRTRSEAAGWALLCIQIACAATYFLSAWAKMRFGGPGWANGAVFAWAIVRRGTSIGDLLLNTPWLLRLSQWGLLTLEFASPLLLLARYRLRWLALVAFGLFHLVTYLVLTIHFLPLVVCLLAFLPVERLVARRTTAAAGGEPPDALTSVRSAATG